MTTFGVRCNTSSTQSTGACFIGAPNRETDADLLPQQSNRYLKAFARGQHTYYIYVPGGSAQAYIARFCRARYELSA